jgi:hypothetical protein
LLVGARQVPVGTIVDTTGGVVALEAASAARGHLQTDTLSRGRFKVLQPRSGRGPVDLRLIDATSAKTCKRSSGRRSARQLGVLQSKAKGGFRTTGHYASATALSSAATWSITDRCDGTLIRVTRGRVTVRDLRSGKRHVVQAGHSYRARAP